MCDNQNFETVNITQVTSNDIKNLLDYFSKHTYGAKAEDLEVKLYRLKLAAVNLELDF